MTKIQEQTRKLVINKFLNVLYQIKIANEFSGRPMKITVRERKWLSRIF